MPVVGTVYLNGCNYQVGYDLVSQSTANNTTTLNFYGKLNVTNNYVSWSSGSASVWNASTGIGTYYSKGTHLLIAKQVTITHKSDGTYSGTLSGSLSTTFVSGTASGNFSLPKIARTITVTNAPNITDEDTTVSVSFTNPANYSALPYMNFYVNGSMVLRLERPTSNYTSPFEWHFTAEEILAMQNIIPNSNTCQVNIGFNTYNGSSGIGYHSLPRTFTIVNANPTFDVAYLDTNSTTTAITNNNQQIIRNNSTLQINLTNITALKSATLVDAKVILNGVTYEEDLSGSTATFNIGTVNISENITSQVIVTDSRGNTTTEDLAIQILDWSTPTALISLARQSNYYSNTYIKADATYSSLDSKNTISIRTRYKKVTDASYGSYETLQDNTQSTLNLDNNYQWNVQVLVEDRIGSTTYNLTVDRGIPIIFFDRSKNSVGINKFPENTSSFEVEGGTYMNGDVKFYSPTNIQVYDGTNWIDLFVND